MKLEDMTPAQQVAITTEDKTVLVVAGPGSGKTATTVERIKRLIENGVDPHTIVAITFTNTAAREMEDRLARSCPKCGGQGWWAEGNDPPEQVPCDCYGNKPGHIGTLHSFALRMLKEHGNAAGYGPRMSIVSPESAEDLLLSKAQSLGCKMKLQDLLKLKAKGKPEGKRLDVPQTAVASYYQDLRDAGIVDFDILLTEFARLLSEPEDMNLDVSFEYLFVDEVQDSGPVDWEIYLALPIANKFFVGDPDQAIYGFRGGDLNGMLWLAKRPGTTVIKLEENFRSHDEICQVAQNLIEHNRDRIDKKTTSTKGPGGQVTAKAQAKNEGHEMAQIASAAEDFIRSTDPLMRGDEIDVAVLCRTNAIAYATAQFLDAAGLPVVMREKSDLPKDWPLCRSLVELMVNPENNTLAFFHLITLANYKGEGPKTARNNAHLILNGALRAGQSVNRFALHYDRDELMLRATNLISRESMMLLGEIVRDTGTLDDPLGLALAVASYQPEAKEKKSDTGIHCITIHAAKGREFDAVFLAGWEDEVMPGHARTTPEIEEERRLAYVAITRARKFVMITSAQTRTTSWGAIAQHTPSRFIAELTDK